MPKIEIDLADLGLPTYQDHDGEPGGAKNLEDLIVEAAVKQLVGSNRSLAVEVRTQVEERITKEIDKRIHDEVEAAFTAPIQRTTPWGDKQGEPTTVRELIRESLQSFLTGKAKRDSYRNTSAPAANLGELIDEATKYAMNHELQATVKEARATVNQKVTAAALKAAVDVLNKQ